MSYRWPIGDRSHSRSDTDCHSTVECYSSRPEAIETQRLQHSHCNNTNNTYGHRRPKRKAIGCERRNGAKLYQGRREKTKIRTNKHGRAREREHRITYREHGCCKRAVVDYCGKTSPPAAAYSSFAIAKSFSDRLQKLVCGVCETQEPLAMADGGRARGGGRGRRTEKRKRHGPTDLTNDGDGRTDGEERIDDRGGGRADGQMEGREGDRQLPGLFTSIHNVFILTWEPFLTYPACLSFLSSCPHLASSLSFSSPR